MDSLGSPYLLLVLAVFFWAGNFVVGRAARDVLPPIAFNFWRWALAFLILAPFTLDELIRKRDVLLRHWRLLALLGFSGLATFHSFNYIGLAQTHALNASLLFVASPPFFALFGWLLFREGISFRQAIAMPCAMAGALLVVTRGEPGTLMTLTLNPGDLWLLASVCLWALYSVMLKKRPPELSPLALMNAVIIAALIWLAPAYAVEIASGRSITLGLPSLLSLGYVTIFASVIGNLFWILGVRQVGANPASLTMPLMPVFGALLAVTFLGERIELFHLGGGAIVVGALLLGRAERGRT